MSAQANGLFDRASAEKRAQGQSRPPAVWWFEEVYMWKRTADSGNTAPTAARLRLAPFGYGPAAHPVVRETLYVGTGNLRAAGT